MVQALAEILEHTGPAEKESGLDVTEKAVGKYARAVFAKKERNRAVCPEPRDGKKGIQCKRSKENSSKEKKKRRLFLCRRTVGVKVKSKVILTTFPKIQEKETFVGKKDQSKREGY